jgi:hypothetical protein
MPDIKPTCPIAWLAPLLRRPTFEALTSALDPAAPISQLISLAEENRLKTLPNISTGRAGDIRRTLTQADLAKSRPTDDAAGSRNASTCIHEAPRPLVRDASGCR